jgi:hypothetical protein
MAIFAGSTICEALHIDSLILADLKGVMIKIDINDDAANLYKIDIGKLKERFENRLENAHIRLYKKETTEYYLSGRPTIWIKIEPSDCNVSDFSSLVFETSFRLTLRTFSNPKATNYAVIAQSKTIKCGGRLPTIFDIADDHINEFIDAFCKFKSSSMCEN